MIDFTTSFWDTIDQWKPDLMGKTFVDLESGVVLEPAGVGELYALFEQYILDQCL